MHAKNDDILWRNDKTNIHKIPLKSMCTPAHTLNSTMGWGWGSLEATPFATHEEGSHEAVLNVLGLYWNVG